MLAAIMCSRKLRNVDFSIFSSGCKQANLSTIILSLQSYENSLTPTKKSHDCNKRDSRGAAENAERKLERIFLQ